MAKNNRDEFSEKTKRQIGMRVGWLCSDPSCRRPTVGSNSDGDGEMNLGTAAHICAAAPGGPRYDQRQTYEQRSSPDNGIWMCKLHGTAIDARDSTFTVELLREWKTQAQKESLQRVLYGDLQKQVTIKPSAESLQSRFRAAAAVDLNVFRRSDKWPATSIALTLEIDGLEHAVGASALAAALITLDDLILVAPPGMGKTSTFFQIAEAVLAHGAGAPIIVPLGDWSADNATLLESVLKRPAFREFSEGDFYAAALKPGLILLLDGWNELDATARKRVAVQVARLQIELPELGFLISTRKQALDVPISGTRVNLIPLSETQQLGIAKALRGDAGMRMLDQAWRTAGVRELVTTPLYLTALLTLPEGAPFPNTKEDLLRHFVAVHEEDGQRLEALAEVTRGFHRRFLADLAAAATRLMNTTLGEKDARRSISETDDALLAEKQITDKPQPDAVLEVLVSRHVLIRAGEPGGYSFQHQQFQEWFASHSVERLIVESVNNITFRDKLKADILNQPPWEEAILFACERLARGNSSEQEACSVAIRAAFEVDPILAAEMIFRSTDSVWTRIASTIEGFVKRWHAPGKVDRALRFMISSGRPEFFDQVWPLITHENDQISLSALRAGSRFRPSILGGDASKRIAALSPSIRKNVLHEIASNSGMDGLDLVATIAKDDPDPKVKATVVDALAFRRADRHLAEVLGGADEMTFDLVARKGLIDEIDNEHIKNSLDAARKRQQKQGISAYERLRALVHTQGPENVSGELTAIIAEMEISNNRDAEVHLLYEARSRYPHAIADGLLQRVRADHPLFYGVDDLLASANLSLEDGTLLEIALSENRLRDVRAEAAASVLGPQAVGSMIEALLNARRNLRDESGNYDKVKVDRYHDLLGRIAHTPGTSLVLAVSARSKHATYDEMNDLADLISHHPNGDDGRGRAFDVDARAAIGVLVEGWGDRMLSTSETTRLQLASIVTMASRAPSVDLLPTLRRLLDEELLRFRAFREEAEATHWRQGKATDEARNSHTNKYRQAFGAINTPETAVLMREYLRDEYFGQDAALVLAAQWTAMNEPRDKNSFRWGVDFSFVEEKRAARARDPAATSTEGEAIFGAIDLLLADEATDDQRKHAVVLGIVAARLPHGQRDATIQTLIALAPRRSRAALLQNLILAGENIDVGTVRSGIAEVFEAAKAQSWILTEGYELKDWLRLLPFVTSPAEALTVVRDLPDDQRTVEKLQEFIAGLAIAPGEGAENVLFQLAETDPRLYADHGWQIAAIRRGTLSAAQRFVNLAASDMFTGRSADNFQMASQLGGLIVQHPEVRAHVYQLLRVGDGADVSGLVLLARAVAESPDVDGLLLLIKLEVERKGSYISWRTMENVVTEHVPSEDWTGSYEVIAVPAGELRRELLAMTTDGGPSDVGARYLNQIDKIRDDYGIPDSEPRHPDLISGKPWPMMTPEPD